MSTNHIATSLIEASRQKSGPKDVLDDLYPFIYTAAKRMSGREISEFLEKNHNVKMSQATISRALQNPAPYVKKHAEKVFCAADTARYLYELSSIDEVLRSEGFADFLRESDDCVSFGDSHAESQYYTAEARLAICELKEIWFPLDPEFKALCKAEIDRPK